MVTNVLLRGMWILNLSLGYFDRVYGPGLGGVLGLLEILRFVLGILFFGLV